MQTDIWEMAQQNVDVLRFSTLVASGDVPRYLGDDEGIDRAIEWCRQHGITRMYLESFRGSQWAPKEMLARARDRFVAAGIDARGCITPAGFAKASTGWRMFSCFTADETRRIMKEMAEHAADVFDIVMIDDFFCSDCTCEECRAAKGERSWADYKCGLMMDVSREMVLDAGRAVNPNVQFIIKYPAWYEAFQERGYEVAAQSELFPMTWVGTETRGVDEDGDEAGRKGRYPPEPQYQAYWLMRWLLGIGGAKCGGGWYDAIETSPRYYVEQGRQTVLGGAQEAFLFNFGALFGGGRRRGHGPEDVAALLDEMPQHFALAGLIRGKRPRGLCGWKPANSPPGADMKLHPLLGMAGLPVTAAHAFDPDAGGFVFGCHVLHDAAWPEAVELAMGTGRPIVVTPSFLEAARSSAEGGGLDLARLESQSVVMPELTDPRRWPALEALPQEELDAMRDRACGGLGASFHAPHGVSLYLFDEDLAVVENFRNQAVRCDLRLDGWSGCEAALAIPADAQQPTNVGEAGRLDVPARSLVAISRTR